MPTLALNSFTTPEFWARYHALPTRIQRLADQKYGLWAGNPRHPSLDFKKVGKVWSVRVGDHYRALARERAEGFVWFWIGTHEEYNKLV